MTGDPISNCYTTLQHIALLAAKRDRLLQTQLEAEDQFLFAITREYNLGQLSEADLATIYIDYRESSATPGYTKRWNKTVPVTAHRLDRVAKQTAIYGDGIWRGTFPLAEDEPTPMTGTPVVYLLFDGENAPCYVGSTMRLRRRLKEHARTGKAFARWQAHACHDRAEAYRIEREWLAEHKPYMNKRTA
jgi:hypothetical protein